MIDIYYNTVFDKKVVNVIDPKVRFRCSNVDIENEIIDINVSPEKPFYIGVRFRDCIIYANDLSAFDSCLFETNCALVVKNMEVFEGGLSHFNNIIYSPVQKQFGLVSKEAIDAIKKAEENSRLSGKQRELNEILDMYNIEQGSQGAFFDLSNQIMELFNK